MSLTYFKLVKAPFGTVPAPRFICIGTPHLDVLASPEYGTVILRLNPWLSGPNWIRAGEQIHLSSASKVQASGRAPVRKEFSSPYRR